MITQLPSKKLRFVIQKISNAKLIKPIFNALLRRIFNAQIVFTS